MGIKDTLYTEKGKIITGILAAVLITTIILVPTSIFIDRSINDNEGNENPLYTFGYDESITSTGKRQDSWMGITPDPEYGMEGTLVSNDNYYMPIDTPEKMIDGVKDSDGIGYLSNINIQQDVELDALMIPFVNESGETIWLEPTDVNYIHAPLNIVMKVPNYVAEVLQKHMFHNDINNTALTIDELNAKEDLNYEYDYDGIDGNNSLIISKDNAQYGDFLVENGLQTDFALSFALFNYIIYTQSAHDALREVGFNTPYNTQGFYDKTDEQFNAWLQTTFGSQEWGINEISGMFDILVDGTGTNEFALNTLINSFNEKTETFGLSPDLQLVQKLEDNGSYTAWETPNEEDLPPGVIFNPDEYDSTQNGRKGAFLGTQSRGIKQDKQDFVNVEYPEELPDGEISYWGYSEKQFTLLNEEINNSSKVPEDDFIYNEQYIDLMKQDDFLDEEISIPLAATMATDNIVFFTTSDLLVMNYETGEMDHPEGLTKQGYKTAYEYGISWDELSKAGQIYFG